MSSRLEDVTALSDDEPAGEQGHGEQEEGAPVMKKPAKRELPVKGEPEPKAKAKTAAAPTKVAEPPTKQEGEPLPESARPSEGAGDPARPSEEAAAPPAPAKRPAAKVMKKPAASSEGKALKVYEEFYKASNSYGLKMNGKQVMAVSVTCPPLALFCLWPAVPMTSWFLTFVL